MSEMAQAAGAFAMRAFGVVCEWYSHGGKGTHTDCMGACLMRGYIERLAALFPAGAVQYAFLPEADREERRAEFTAEAIAVVEAYEMGRV